MGGGVCAMRYDATSPDEWPLYRGLGFWGSFVVFGHYYISCNLSSFAIIEGEGVVSEVSAELSEYLRNEC